MYARCSFIVLYVTIPTKALYVSRSSSKVVSLIFRNQLGLLNWQLCQYTLNNTITVHDSIVIYSLDNIHYIVSCLL